MNNGGVFFGLAWFMSYFMLFISFVVWAWRWCAEIATAQATCFWFALSCGLGALGVWVVIRLARAPE